MQPVSAFHQMIEPIVFSLLVLAFIMATLRYLIDSYIHLFITRLEEQPWNSSHMMVLALMVILVAWSTALSFGQ